MYLCYSVGILSGTPMDANKQFYIPPDGPPQGISPNPEIFSCMGQDNIYQMLEDFYLRLETSSIRHLFPDDLIAASKRSAAFYVFILGGPPLYQQQYGPPMMRKRHLPFPIDEEARQVWLSCFYDILKKADEKYNFPKQHLPGFCHFLEQFSGWMVNTK